MTSLSEQRPLGLFLTWTTYGTWEPGDPRGHVSNTLMPDGRYRPRENRWSVDYDRDSPQTLERAQRLQRGETVWLNPQQAHMVAESFIQSAIKHAWWIERCAVMSNHVHVLLTQCPADASTIQRILKGCSQQALSLAVGHSRRWWTRKGSQRSVTGGESLEAVIRYIEQQPSILSLIRGNRIGVPYEPQG